MITARTVLIIAGGFVLALVVYAAFVTTIVLLGLTLTPAVWCLAAFVAGLMGAAVALRIAGL